jgi:C4-dicarboxylate-specific signal transduction histidine kinase
MILNSRARDEVAVFLTDLAELKRAQSALLQSEKLAAVGRLSASSRMRSIIRWRRSPTFYT